MPPLSTGQPELQVPVKNSSIPFGE